MDVLHRTNSEGHFRSANKFGHLEGCTYCATKDFEGMCTNRLKLVKNTFLV